MLNVELESVFWVYATNDWNRNLEELLT
jgi:hypothetical protein